jgi:ABC-type uncharacterized transport system substrate-binding protein
MLLAVCFPADAQQSKKMPRVGFLIAGSPSAYSTPIEAFRNGLRELGYVEGQNIIIEYRYAEGQENRLADIAAEMVRLKVEVIVATGTQATSAAEKQPRRSRWSWGRPVILSGPDLSRACRSLEETSRDLAASPRK